MSTVALSARLTEALADRYTVIRELGAGGMATVYLAEDLRHRRKVAIKLLHAELSAVLGSERFLKEIELTASLQHPHILPLFDSGSADGLLYYVMPFVEGETLRGRLERETQLPVRETVRLTREVADALEYAHARGVIHRDIKPENILLHGGHALVADFGIALAVEQAGGHRMTQTGLSLGTPHYMAPEQAMGEKAVDARADIYALGAVTYEMLVGEPPFTGPTAQAILAKVMTEKPSPPSRARESIPPALEDAVLTALAKLPADRWESAREFAQALDAEGPSLRRPTDRNAPAQPPARTLLRDPRTWVTVAAVAVALVALVALARAPGDVAPVADGATITTLLPGPDETWAYNGSQMALSPDGRRLVIRGSVPGSQNHLLLRAMDDPGTTVLRGTQGAGYPFWSPDGTQLGYFADGQLRILNIETGGVRILCSGIVPRGASWGRNGDILYAARGTEEWAVHHVPAAGGSCVELALEGPEGIAFGRPYFLPNGRDFVLTTDQRAWLGRLGQDSVSLLAHLSAAQAVLAPPDYLLVRPEDGGLYAQRIDLSGRRLAGSNVRVVDRVTVLGGDISVTASSNGALAVYGLGPTGRRVVAVASRSSATIETIPLEGDPGTYLSGRGLGSLRLSRDGRSVALAGWGLWLLDLDRKVLRRLPVELDTARVFMVQPVWSPGDTLIAVMRAFQDFGFTLFDTRTDRATRWFDEPIAGRFARAVDWSPDGRFLLLEVTAGAGAPYAEIWMLDTTTGESTPLARERGNVGQPIFSPDGRWVAYHSSADDRQEVYLRPFPGPGTPIRVSTAGGRAPRWGAGGRELLYMASGPVIMAVPISVDGRPGTPVPATRLPAGLEFNSFDVTADGQTLVFSMGEGAEEGLTLVQNWWSLLPEMR